MSTEENKAIVRRWYEEDFTKGNLAAVDELIVKHTLIALGYLAAQEGEEYLNNSSVPMKPQPLWIVDHHERLRPARIASIPDYTMNAEPAA